MKGLNLSIRILIVITLVLFVVAGVLDYANSLSSLHYTFFDYILLACLLSIYTALHDTAKVATERDKELTALYLFKKRISYKLKHALKYTAWLFGGVIIFGVNSEAALLGVKVYYLHLIFTALAIISGYSIVLLYPETIKGRNISYYLTIFGALFFSLGFFFDIYSVTWAELLVALPIAYTIYLILKI